MLVEDPNAVRVQVNREKQRAAERASRRASRIDRDLARQRDQAQADSLVRRLEKEYMKEQEKRKGEKRVKIEQEYMNEREKRKGEKTVKLEQEYMKEREKRKGEKTVKIEQEQEKREDDGGKQEKRKDEGVKQEKREKTRAHVEWPWKPWEKQAWWGSFKRDDQPLGGFPGAFFWFAFFVCALLAAFSTAERNGYSPTSNPGQAFALIWETVSFTIAVGGVASVLWYLAQIALRYFSGILVFSFLWWGQMFLVLVMINFLASTFSNSREEVQKTASWWPWSQQPVLTDDEKWQNNLFAEIIGGFDSFRGYIPALDDNPLAIVYKTLSVPTAVLGASGVTFSLFLTQLGIGVKDQLTFAFNVVGFGVKEAWQVIRPFISTDTMRNLRLLGLVVLIVLFMFVYKQEFTTQVMYNLFAIQPTAVLYSYFMKRVKSSIESKEKKQINERKKAPKPATTADQVVVIGRGTVIENSGNLIGNAAKTIAELFTGGTAPIVAPEPSSVEQRLVTMLAGAGVCTPRALEWLLFDVPMFCGDGSISDALSVENKYIRQTRILSIVMLIAKSDEKLAAKIGAIALFNEISLLSWVFSNSWQVAIEALSSGSFLEKPGDFSDFEQIKIDAAREEFDLAVATFYSFENISDNKDLFDYMKFNTSNVVDEYKSGKRGFIGKDLLRSLQVNTWQVREVSFKVRILIQEMKGKDCELCSDFKKSSRIVTDNERLDVYVDPTKYECDPVKEDGFECTITKSLNGRYSANTERVTCYEIQGPGATEAWCFQKNFVGPMCELSAELASV
jgi:hypothetical protein